jgi:tetratricopeptide (TPR) repeat protein
MSVAPDDINRCLIYEARGEALMALGRYPEALADFQACLSIPEPGLDYAHATTRGLWQTYTSKARAKRDEVKSRLTTVPSATRP